MKMFKKWTEKLLMLYLKIYFQNGLAKTVIEFA